MKRLCLIACFCLLAGGVQAQAPASLAAALKDAEQVVVDTDKALAIAAPDAYRAHVASVRVRNQLRALMAAEQAKQPKPNESK